MKLSGWKRWIVTVNGTEYVLEDEAARPRLCDVTGLHDPRPDGVCRDCAADVRPQDPVCAPDVLIHAQPDGEQP